MISMRSAHNNGFFRSLPANETFESVFTYFSINLKLIRFNGMLVPVSLYLAYGEREILSNKFLKPSSIASFSRFHTTKHLYI